MAPTVQFNRDKFFRVFEDHLTAVRNMGEAMESIGDPRDVCVVKAMKAAEIYLQDILTAVDTGKKFLWHEFLFLPELFMGFPGVQPYMSETLTGFLCLIEPEGLTPYIDAARNIGLPPDICPTDSGLLGCVLEEIQPPAHVIVSPTTPCDSALCAYQIIQKLMDVPVVYCDTPYWHDERSVDLYARQIWNMIRQVEEILGVRMDWDKCREHIRIANESMELFYAEGEMRKLKPCPHPGKLPFYHFLFFEVASGTDYLLDVCKFIIEDSRKLAAAKKGAVQDERIRLLLYNPDPVYDTGIHDWLEDEYKAITAMTLFGHPTATFIDPTTPETIVRDYAWKMMNICMARQYRGPHEYFVDDMIAAIDGWDVDAVIVTAHIPCKHGQGAHGFIRQACRERDKPLLVHEIDVQDPRPVSIDKTREAVAEFLETQVLPYK